MISSRILLARCEQLPVRLSDFVVVSLLIHSLYGAQRRSTEKAEILWTCNCHTTHLESLQSPTLFCQCVPPFCLNELPYTKILISEYVYLAWIELQQLSKLYCINLVGDKFCISDLIWLSHCNTGYSVACVPCTEKKLFTQYKLQ